MKAGHYFVLGMVLILGTIYLVAGVIVIQLSPCECAHETIEVVESRGVFISPTTTTQANVEKVLVLDPDIQGCPIPEEVFERTSGEEAPQIFYEGQGNWRSPEFTVINPWLLEYTGDVRIVVVQANGVQLAKQAVESGFHYYTSIGTFHLEFFAPSGSPWTATISEER